MNIHEKMQLAIDLAVVALNEGEIPIAAVIFLGDEIIAKSYATEKADQRYLVHAELKALLKADLLNFSIQERRKMQLFATLEPCMMCLGAAMSFCIGEVYYAIESPTDGAVNIAEQAWKEESEEFSIYKLPAIFGVILRNESKKLFIEYMERNKYTPGFVKSIALL